MAGIYQLEQEINQKLKSLSCNITAEDTERLQSWFEQVNTYIRGLDLMTKRPQLNYAKYTEMYIKAKGVKAILEDEENLLGLASSKNEPKPFKEYIEKLVVMLSNINGLLGLALL